MEWCPDSSFIVCGNYQLEEAGGVVGDQDEEATRKPSRQGCVYLMEAMPDNSLEVHECIETRGILDQKWFDGQTVGVVTSTGQLMVYGLDKDARKLMEKTRVSLDESEETIALSLDFWERKTLVSDSKGFVSLFDSELRETASFAGHGFEAWTCAFDRSDPNVFYSGESSSRYLNNF